VSVRIAANVAALLVVSSTVGQGFSPAPRVGPASGVGDAQAPAPAPPADLDARLAEARALVDAGKATQALQVLAALPSTEPRVQVLEGVAAYHADQYVRAIDRLAPLVRTLPASSPARREAVQVLGLSSYLAGRLSEAMPLLEETASWALDNQEFAQVLGMAYIQVRQPDKARVALARAFGVDPATPAARVLAAQMMVRIEFFDLAEAELRKALADDPRLPRANFLLGQAAIFRNQPDEAIACFERELAIDPADAMALYRLGETYARKSDWDRAIPALQRSLWINPFYSGPYIVLGRAYVAKGQLQTAEGMLRRAVEFDPNNQPARYLLGQALQRLGRTDEAREQLEIAATLGQKKP
jgi:tetratricopeptide (TPR) repeat protein